MCLHLDLKYYFKNSEQCPISWIVQAPNVLDTHILIIIIILTLLVSAHTPAFEIMQRF